MKVVKSEMSESWSVVVDTYGQVRTNDHGQKYTYTPLPLCRVPVGYGRTDEQAKALAERIAMLLNVYGASDG